MGTMTLLMKSSSYQHSECGADKIAFLDITDECGISRDMTELRYFTGLCDRKENGQYCYELFSNAAEFALHTQLPCYVTAELNGTCICRSELTSMAKEFGCCANYFELLFQNNRRSQLHSRRSLREV